MKKHWRLAAGLITAAALALTGCGGGQQQSSDDKTIELWTAWTEGAATQQALEPKVQEWAEANGYTVNLTNFSFDQLRQKLVASAAGGNLPDVVWGLPEHLAEYNKLGILADVTDAWEDWDGAKLVSDSVRDGATVDGKIVGFPYSATVRAYLVHDSKFEEAGKEIPKTWEEVVALGSSIEDATGSSAYGLTGVGARAPQELLVYLAQKELAIAEKADGGYRNTWKDDPAKIKRAAEVFQFYKDAIDSGAANPNSATYGWEETDENFATGLTASFVSGNWLAEREESNPDSMGDVSVNQIPVPSDGVPATYLEVKSLFVMANTANLEGSIGLAQAFASEDWQKAGFPERSSLTSVTTDSKWSTDFAALVEYGVTYPPVTLSSITQNMIDALAKVLQSGESPEAAAEWLSDQINASLEQSGELGK